MQKKQFEYGMYGLLIGVILGALVGLGMLSQTKKSQRAYMLPSAIGLGAVLIGISGYGVGSKIGKNIYIEERLGINKPTEDGYLKDGRYWVGLTKWVDKRDNKEYTIFTARSNRKNLVSVLNDRTILIHNCQSAAKDTVPKYHTQARNYVWNQLKEKFTEEPTAVENLIPTIN